ncbi:hypothetical protein [Halobacillus sp. A5]|uniref:hypothetical protein n=1 Tax=Halobacillus sp. A5 TaxID=2880263 RepID=UPI0020A66C78|nr:hypothetical protein [Halobacillus sp. A5]MCP3028702.1 hypothetical protein [Halobacillus sp. A5]
MNEAVNFFPIVAFIPIIFYIAILIFIVWFALTIVKTQKEKNHILKEISNGIREFNINKKE